MQKREFLCLGDDTTGDYDRLETELVAQGRAASRVATADVDEATARRPVGDLIEDDVVTPIPAPHIPVHELSNEAFESITQLAVFHRGWQAATGVDTEDD